MRSDVLFQTFFEVKVSTASIARFTDWKTQLRHIIASTSAREMVPCSADLTDNHLRAP